MAVDAKAQGKLGLGRQLGAGWIKPLGDLGLQAVGD
jgi:hypothetical protein